MNDVVFVNDENLPVGAGTIDDAVRHGYALRIARVILINEKGEWLLQRRSSTIRMPLLWNESATGHVDVGETDMQAAAREMKEEIGAEGVALSEVGSLYLEEPRDGLIKKSFHTLYVGVFNGVVTIDTSEVSEVRWIAPRELRVWMTSAPQDFTVGALLALEFFMKTMRTPLT
ncbi:MAG: NUDIX domain-containing protein [Patescibacteria group bacterium]